MKQWLVVGLAVILLAVAQIVGLAECRLIGGAARDPLEPTVHPAPQP